MMLTVGLILIAISLFIGMVFGSTGMRDNWADLLSYLMFGAGVGVVFMWALITVIGLATA